MPEHEELKCCKNAPISFAMCLHVTTRGTDDRIFMKHDIRKFY